MHLPRRAMKHSAKWSIGMLLAVTLAALGIWWFSSTADIIGAGTPVSEASAAPISGVAEAGPGEVSTFRVLDGPDPNGGSVMFRVRDDTGSSLAGVELHPVTVSARRAASTVGAPAWITDEGGQATLRRDSLAFEALAVVGQRHEVVVVPATAWSRKSLVEVVLARTRGLRIVCSQRDGVRVPRCRVLLSQQPVVGGRDHDAPGVVTYPFGSRDAAVYSGSTDAQGVVTVPWYPEVQGALYCAVEHTGHVVTAEHTLPRMIEPGADGVPTIHLALDPVYAAIATIEDDVLLSWSGTTPTGCAMPGASFEQLTWVAPYYRRMCAAQVLVLLGVPLFVDGAYASVAPAVECTAYCERRGLVTFQCPVARLEHWPTPHACRLPAGGRSDAVRVVISLSTPRGADLTMPHNVALVRKRPS